MSGGRLMFIEFFNAFCIQKCHKGVKNNFYDIKDVWMMERKQSSGFRRIFTVAFVRLLYIRVG